MRNEFFELRKISRSEISNFKKPAAQNLAKRNFGIPDPKIEGSNFKKEIKTENSDVHSLLVRALVRATPEWWVGASLLVQFFRYMA